MTQGTAGILEERHDRYIELIKQFTIMNDIFMRNVLKEKACTEFILQIITENIGLRIVEQVLQMDYANLHGRAARLDCVALDTANKVYNLEIQQENEGALPKRPRYHASLLDANILEPGTEFQNLPCTTVIFITKNDVLGGGLPIYHISRTVREVEADFGDELDIIYVNGSNHDDTELGRLIHDLNCREAKDMYSKVLAARVHMLKETKEGVEIMCEELQELYDEGVKEGEMLGEMKKAKRSALLLSKKGTALSDIAEVLEVGIDIVQEWLSEVVYE